jgi:hypothetical protein
LRIACIFHIGSSRGAANPDAKKKGDGLQQRLYVSYCPRSNSKLTQYPSGVSKLQQNQYEIGGLTRIFQTDRDEEAAKADGVPPAVGRPRGRLPLGSPERARRTGASESTQASILMQGCMCTYYPNQNVSLTQHPSGFPASVVDQYEISGLKLSILFKCSHGVTTLELILHERKGVSSSVHDHTSFISIRFDRVIEC